MSIWNSLLVLGDQLTATAGLAAAAQASFAATAGGTTRPPPPAPRPALDRPHDDRVPPIRMRLG